MLEKISIIIPSYNTSDQTVKLIRQVATSIFPTNKNIIIIENGSIDESKESIKLLAEELSVNMFIIDNSINLGFTKAINQGIKLSEKLGCKYHCFLNTDIDIKNENLFVNMIQVLQMDSEYGCIIPHDAVIGANLDKRVKWINNNIAVVDEGMWYCVMIPQTTIDRIGILDERFFLHSSDSDYQMRITRAGMKVAALRNSNDINHTSFMSTRKLPNKNQIIKNDRLLLRQKYVNTNDEIIPNTPRVEVRASSDTPFLTILTRCYKRPNMLEKCKKSIDDQTLQDYEQIFIIDNIGRGRPYANKAFEIAQREYYIRGQYVMILDDDDIIIDKGFIQQMKTFVDNSRHSAIIFQGKVGNKILPPDHLFGREQPRSCQIGSFSIVVRKDVFNRHLPKFGSDNAIGDFKFIESIWKEDPFAVKWYKKLCCETQRVSLFKPE